MAKGIVDFCKNLTTMISPILDSKERENRRLKRLIQDRYKRGASGMHEGGESDNHHQSDNEDPEGVQHSKKRLKLPLLNEKKITVNNNP